MGYKHAGNIGIYKKGGSACGSYIIGEAQIVCTEGWSRVSAGPRVSAGFGVSTRPGVSAGFGVSARPGISAGLGPSAGLGSVQKAEETEQQLGALSSHPGLSPHPKQNQHLAFCWLSAALCFVMCGPASFVTAWAGRICQHL